MDSNDTLENCIYQFCRARAERGSNDDGDVRDLWKQLETEFDNLKSKIGKDCVISLGDFKDVAELLIDAMMINAYKQGCADGVKIKGMLETHNDPPPPPCKKCSGHLER